MIAEFGVMTESSDAIHCFHFVQPPIPHQACQQEIHDDLGFQDIGGSDIRLRPSEDCVDFN